jgi:Concanavalin A-like lectin/glucanases superfamily
MNRLRLAAVGTLALIVSLAVAGVAQARGPLPGALELPGSRTASSTTYLNPDGSYTAVVASHAVNYRDASGSWQPIDTALVASGVPGYAYENASGAFRTLFKDDAGDGFLRFDTGGSSYMLGLQNAVHASARTHGSSISYDGALPSTRVGYTVLSSGLKETMTLADAKGPDTFRYVLSGAGALTAEARTDGAVAFSEPGAARPTFVLSSPWAADTAGGRVVHVGETHPQLSAHRLGNGDWQIAVAVDRAWLASPARRFPVVVDPTISIVAAQDAEFETTCSNAPCQTRDDDPMSIGGDDVSTYAVGVQFDLTAVPADATVSDATLGLHFTGTCGWTSRYGFDCPPSSHTIDAYGMTAPWSEGSVTPQTAPADVRYDPTAIGSATIAAGAPAGWLSWNVAGAAQSWVAGTQANDGLLLRHDPELLDTGAPTFESSEDDPSLAPRLDVTYSGGSTPPPTTPTYAQTITADSPVGYWKLGDLGTRTAADSSGLNHPGDYSGTFVLGQPGLLAHPSDTAVTFRNASFDGRMVTQYLYGYAGSAVTAETWVRYTGATGLDQLVTRNYPSNGGWMLGLTRTNGVQQAQFTVVRSGVKLTASASVSPGTLYLAGSYDGSVVRLYVNGALAASRALSGAPLSATANTVLAGTLVDDVTLDEPAVYDHALGAAQVSAHYSAGTK